MRIIPFFKGSGMWLFHIHSTVKIQPFFQFSLLREPRLGHFSGHSFGVSRKKASITFYNAAFLKWENTRQDFSHAL